MKKEKDTKIEARCMSRDCRPTAVVIALFLACFNLFSETLPDEPDAATATSPLKPVRPQRRSGGSVAEWPTEIAVSGDSLGRPMAVEGEAVSLRGDSLVATGRPRVVDVEPEGRIFNPDPSRAVWLSALFPGLGQLYNRRYWKLPIVIGGFMGLGYATSWNHSMLRDYTRAYADIMDNDPSTKSYMDFFPPTTQESDLNKTWLENVLKSRKNFYRRNRDLCIICMVGVYLLAMVDAYVDASLAHFDISPDLALDLGPAVIPEGRERLPGIGLQWALTFR